MVEVTEYEYDGDRLVRSVTTRPGWTEDDVELLLAWQERDNLRGPHGQPVDEAQSPLADPANRRRQWEYVAEPVIDFAQKARDDAAAAYREANGDSHGVTFRVRKLPRPT